MELNEELNEEHLKKLHARDMALLASPHFRRVMWVTMLSFAALGLALGFCMGVFIPR